MTVVYIDSVLLLNTAMNYVLLLATARLAGLALRRWNYFCAAIVGGGYAAVVFLPGLSFLAHPLVKLAVGAILVLIAFGAEQHLLRLTVLFFAVSCAMAGTVLGLGLLAGSSIPSLNGIFFTNVDEAVLLVAAAAFYLILKIVFHAAAKPMVAGERLPIRICACGNTAELTALLDSGNCLRDPIGGKSVLVLAPAAVRRLLPPPVCAAVTESLLGNAAELVTVLRQCVPELRPRLITYQAVGTSAGLMVVITTEWAEIGGKIYRALPAALSPTALGEGCTALWGGDVGRGKLHGMVEGTAGAFGLAAGRRGSLYRRQRHTAAAAEPGAGGGASFASGGGSGQKRADRA